VLGKEDYVKLLKWWPFNNDPSNFAQINNQQSDSVSALAEKIINSIDAMLLKACKEGNIDPESVNAPKTMKDAAENFFGVKDGNLSNLDDRTRRTLAKNIRVIADGTKECPNIMIVDFGEGQNPADFKSTLLSLNKHNKQRTQFVQGKYGMGGTGVIPFCGSSHKNYVLMLSRKYPKILEKGQTDTWGFTLIRKAPDEHLDPRDKHGYWECLVDENNDVLSFVGIPLKILPDEEKMEYGCYIKLFNYDLEDPSTLTLGLWRAFNRRLYAPVLPIMIHETRKFGGHSETKIMQGNKFRILKDENKYVNKVFSIDADLGAFGKKKIDVVVFKDVDEEGNVLRKKSEWTTLDEEIFLTVNGQTFHTLPRYWISQNTNLVPLSDFMLVHIDCTDVNKNVADPIFLGSKDRVRTNNDYRVFKETLKSLLNENTTLQLLNEEYKRRELERLVPDKSIAKSLIKNLISKNKVLAEYFGIGGDIPIDEGEEVKAEFSGQYIPTFLKIAKKYEGDILVKEVPVNSHRVVLLLTDALDDYLTRIKDRGDLVISVQNDKFKAYAWYLSDGLLPIWLKNNTATEGEEVDVRVKLTRPKTEPLEVKFRLKAIAPHIKEVREGPVPERKEKGIALPELVPVYIEKKGEKGVTCKDLGWTENDIAKVDKNIAVYVNMDSVDLNTFLRTNPKSLSVSAETLYKVGIYLNAILLDMELSKLPLQQDRDLVFNTMLRTISKTILPMYFDKRIQQALE
jgi:regulator of replication initiation timing